ncbi:MAG: TonB-dependent receptor [Gemmatimonadota bacterium]
MHSLIRPFGLATLAVLTVAGGLEAQSPAPRPAGAGDTLVYVLEPIVVEGRIDDLVGTVSTASVGYVGLRDLRLRPLTREAELLETVPGMILTQHSGDGKSNQMFVRGFNLDHGTDFSTRIEGMPVNVPTHAHGQGYTDLNFIIPELVDHVEYSLGNYYAEIGDFGSAGGAHLRLRRTLDRPLFSAGLGENGFARAVAAASAAAGGGTLLAGAEVKGYDGPWEKPQDLRKLSGMARWSRERPGSVVSLLALAYHNRWQSSDQIPLRAVQSGQIGRFGQLDPTLGGESSRYSLSGTWMRIGSSSSQRVDAYAIHYDLDLFSNFTFLLDEPSTGDQIRQRDRGRWTTGLNLAHVQPLDLGGRDHRLTVGLQVRRDDADVTLSRTAQRTPVRVVRSDQVTQWGSGLFGELVSEWSPVFRTTFGVRGDDYRFDVTSDRPQNSGTANDRIVSPKISLAFGPFAGTELYVSGGLGFHSNDARGTVATIDPVTEEAIDPVDPLVRSRGAEIGFRSTPVTGLRSTFALWAIELDSELLFVGDAGTTEPSDGSRRVGVTFANFYRFSPRVTADLDVSFTRARFLDVDEGQDRIPGALENVVAAGVAWEPGGDGPFAALRLRHFGAYPLIEDDSERARPTSLVNLNLGWQRGPARLGVAFLNLLDAEDSDIQYFYGSRLTGEPVDGVEDLHFHPAEPRQVRVTLSWGF